MSCRIWGSRRTRRRCRGRRWWPYSCSAPRSNPEIMKNFRLGEKRQPRLEGHVGVICPICYRTRQEISPAHMTKLKFSTPFHPWNYTILGSAKTGYNIVSSVPDPDPHVFGPPESKSISQKDPDLAPYLYQQAKIVRKTLIPTVLRLLFDFLSLKNYVNVHSKSIKQKNFF